MSTMDLQNSFARACHDFPGSEQGDLAFTSGDVLYIDRQIDRNWCHGQSLITGRSGIFPSNFVTKLNLPTMHPSSGVQKLFIARDRFIGQMQGDLSFLEGDIVLGIRQIDENWWEGEAGGRKGIFPLTFIVELSPPLSNRSFPASNGQNSTSTNVKQPLSVSVSTTNELKAKVKLDLRPVDAQELELKAGEIVIIEEFIDKFTCRGRTLNGRRGLFGKGFVEILNESSSNGSKASTPLPVQSMRGSSDSNMGYFTPLTSPAVTAEKPKASPKPSPKPPVSTRPNGSTTPVNLSATTQENVAPYGRTRYKFEAEYPGELSFSAGVIIQLIRHVDEEWTEGILNGRRGIFPTSYIDIVVDCPRMQLISPRSAATSKKMDDKIEQFRTENTVSASPVKAVDDSRPASMASSNSENVDASKDPTWTVKFDFMGTEDGDLTAFKGDPVVVIRRINDEWLESRHGITGQIGVIPTSYVSSPEPVVRWRNERINLRDNDAARQSTQNALVESTIAQNIRRLEDKPLLPSSRRDATRWSPSPGITSQTSTSSLVSSTPPVPPSPNFWSIDNGVQLKPKPTVPQQIQAIQQKPPVEQKKAPPPRPAVPAALKMRQETASQHLEMQRQQAKEQKKKDMRVQRSRIIQEILTTERDYGKDTTLFKDTVLSKRNMLDANGLLGGQIWSNIIDLSAKLLAMLEDESGKDFVYQEIGSVFLHFAEAFKEIYGAFCQSHEESQALLDKYETEPEKHVVLKDMLAKIQQRTTCIDLSTMLSRPVQRVLKYPLFLGELLKCTEDSTSDKVQIMKALKVMTEVAQTMNESKRRKDLVTKYRKDGDFTFSERLSRISLHSVRKKSTRLSMRLTSTIGLTQLAKDDQFEDAERQFRAVDRCCRNLLRDVQSYCEQVVVLYNHRMSIADALHYGIFNGIGGGGAASTIAVVHNISSQKQTGSASAGSNRLSTSLSSSAQLSAKYLESWSRILLSESILQKLFDTINGKVRQPLAHIQHSCKGPEKLISKRGDKLLDYESVASKLEKTDTGGAVDSAKITSLEEELRKARAEYDAMNTQLLTELPQFNRLASEIITMALRAFIAAQRTFVYEFGLCFEQTMGVGHTGVTVSDGSVLEKFQRKHRLTADAMSRLCFVSDVAGIGIAKSSTGGGGTLVKRQSPSVSRVSSTATPSKSRPAITFPHKLQTESERRLLRGQYGEHQLFVVSGGYEARGDLELTLKDGDLVGVIVDKDPMGSNERWFVDNGVSKGFVPRNVLKSPPEDKTNAAASGEKLELIELTEAEDKKKRNTVANFARSMDASPKSAATQQRQKSAAPSVPRRRGSPVIFMPPEKQHSSSRETTTSEPAARPFGRRATVDHRGGNMSMTAAPTARPSSMVGSMEKPSEEPSYTPIERKVPRRPAPSPPKDPNPSASEVVLQPVRPAPRPPPQVSSTSDLNHVQKSEREERESNDEETEEAVEFYVAMYNFTANSENELSLSEGQIVAVHDKKDLESNPDWWLVEDDDGSLGYVPGNYLNPYTAESEP